jgi:hypothetical protein
MPGMMGISSDGSGGKQLMVSWFGGKEVLFKRIVGQFRGFC